MTHPDTYAALLERHGARYTLIDHPPEGATEIVSQLRGNPPAHPAKCNLLTLKIDRKRPAGDMRPNDLRTLRWTRWLPT